MTTYNDDESRAGRRVTLAWVVLALQIIGLLWLLLFARDRLAAMFGAEPAATVVPTQVAAVDEPAADSAADDAATAEAAAATAAAEAAPTAEPPVAEDDVIPPGQVVEEAIVDTSPLATGGAAAAPEWLAQVVSGEALAEAGDTAALPPHMLLTFRDPAQPELELAAPTTIDLNRPQIRIVAIADLLAWLQARGDAAGEAALEELQSLLDEQPAADEASLPVPPILSDATQALVARMAYGEFNDGQGVGYVTHLTGDSVTPVTNETGLNYVYQGVTADDNYYVFMVWPVDADYLAEPSADAEAALASDPDAYYRTIAAQVEAAADDETTPALSRLWRLAGSLAVGATAVRAAAAQPAPATPEEAAGIVWNWTSSSGGDGDETSVANPTDYSLIFWPDGTFSFVADCNVGRGVYEVTADGALALAPGAMTRAACPPGSQDAEFLQTLPAARALAFDESGDLILTLADGREAVFANGGQTDSAAAATPEEQPDAADAGFTGLNLQWPGFTAADGSAVEVDDPADYSLVLLPDGTYSIRADCNVGGGTFEYDEVGGLTLLPGPLTRVACPEGSQSEAFLSFLSGVSGVTVADDGAVTMTTADGGSATFISAGPLTDAEPADEAADPLLGRVWQWTAFEDSAGLNDLTVDDPESYLLTLLPDGAFTFRADCNVGRGLFTEDDGGLLLEVGPMTRAACEEGSLGDRFVSFLGASATYVIDDDGQLVLNLMADSGNLIFADGGPAEVAEETPETEEQLAAESIGLSSQTLQWAGFTDADGNEVEVANPENYLLALLPDGTFTFKADCNVGSGVYEYADDGTVTLTTLVMTRAACPAGSQADAFLDVLNGTGGVSLDDEGNPTFARADGGSATFVTLGPVEAPAEQPDDAAAPDGELTNIVWQWTSLSDAAGATTEVADPERYTLTFLDDTYTFVADCNRGVGEYTRDGATLSLTPGAMTLVACEAGSLSDQFIGFFDLIAGYEFDGDNLLLTLADGGVLTLANGGPFDAGATGSDTVEDTNGGTAAPLAGITWRWATFRDAKQDYVVPTTADYTILFNDDGTVNVVADCNSGAGTYTVNSDATLTIVVQAMTRAACPPGSLSDSFIEYLNQAGPFAVGDDGILTIDLMADGGTMTFVPEP